MEGAKIFEENGPPQEASLSENSSSIISEDELLEAKIIARPSPEDDYAPSVLSSHHRRCVSVDATTIAKVPAPTLNGPTKSSFKNHDKVQIDTAAPFESVKAAVSKFGGIVDWKAHRVHTVERRKFIEIELEKAQEEMPSYKQQCESAEEAKTQVLKELESTKRLIEELKLNLERAQTEEQQAKQDSELAKLRVEEMEQGIADESSFAAKAQLEVAKARHAAAVSELKTVRDELEQLRKDYALLIAEKDAAETKAQEAVSVSKMGEKSVENLTIQLITLKQSLDSEHSSHLEAEEHRIGAVMAKEQDSLNWELELKQAEEELDKLNQQMLSTKDLKSKLAEASALLQDLKAELAAYMESETGREKEEEDSPKTRGHIEAGVAAAKKDLLDVKHKIEKAMDEVNAFKVASTSLKSELEKETAHLEAIRRREETASAVLESLEKELDRIKLKIAAVHEERERMAELPKQVEEAAREAEEAKVVAQIARVELEKAKHEAGQAKAGASTAESKLAAVRKEIESAKAGEKLALAAITALEESECAEREVESPTSGITLSLDEYYMLSKRAHEAEEEARTRVDEAMSQIQVAKESELKSLNKLEEVSREISQRRDALETANQKADEATQGKLSVEQELRKWRAEHQERRNANAESNNSSSSSSSLHQRSSPKAGAGNAAGTESASEHTKTKKKKKSFFPRFFMFLGKRKTHHSASSAKTD